MPNVLDSTGLTLRTQSELIAFYTARFQAIYGADINLGQSTPDGQMMMIWIQEILDMQDLFMQIYNSFDPDNAIGKVLDQRAAINGIQRQAGTFTTTFISVTISQAVTLYGIDQIQNEIFTVSDNAGNKWELIESIALSVPGTYQLIFESMVSGAVLTVPNTITTPVSIVLGVSSINNPTTYSTLGLNEETDAQFKIRRQKSVALSSQGYREGLLASLKNLSGMTSAFVYENNTASTDADGTLSHSIWIITSGTANPSDIANAIYRKRNAGCGMRGAQQITIAQASGTPLVVRWDNVAPQALYIKFTLTSLDGVRQPNIAAIVAGLVANYAPGVAEQVNINTLADQIRLIDSNALVTNAGFSLTYNGTYYSNLTPTAKNNQFSISANQIIATPMQISPATAIVGHGLTKQFSSLGGYGTIAWTVSTNVSGGSINSSGLYTAGATLGSDVVRATDALGNFAEANVAVS